jgi:hypothetical protein
MTVKEEIAVKTDIKHRRRRSWRDWSDFEPDEKRTDARAGYEKLVDRPQVQSETKLRPTS